MSDLPILKPNASSSGASLADEGERSFVEVCFGCAALPNLRCMNASRLLFVVDSSFAAGEDDCCCLKSPYGQPFGCKCGAAEGFGLSDALPLLSAFAFDRVASGSVLDAARGISSA